MGFKLVSGWLELTQDFYQTIPNAPVFIGWRAL